MPTDAEIEAAAKGIAASDSWDERSWNDTDGPPRHTYRRHAEAALIAAERVREKWPGYTQEQYAKAAYYRGEGTKETWDEARSEGCPDCGRPTRYFHAGPMGPSAGDKGEFLKVPYKCECKAGDEARTQPDDALKPPVSRSNVPIRFEPETGQPTKFSYDAGYDAGFRDAEARIVALIEARLASGERNGEEEVGLVAALTAIQEEAA